MSRLKQAVKHLRSTNRSPSLQFDQAIDNANQCFNHDHVAFFAPLMDCRGPRRCASNSFRLCNLERATVIFSGITAPRVIDLPLCDLDCL